MSNFSFEVLYQYGKARIGRINTAHGSFETPAFIPVATNGAIRTLPLYDLQEIGYNCIMCNTYHLMRNQKVREKGLHEFLGWTGIIFTDSGGFQVFSLGARLEDGLDSFFPGDKPPRKTNKRIAFIDENGVYFKDPRTDKIIYLTPEESVKIQEEFGSDIFFTFDECTSPYHERKYVEQAVERTHRWALRCLEAKRSNNALYGIVQGGIYRDLREESAKFIGAQPFQGFGIGGDLGKTKNEMGDIFGWVLDVLPGDKPVHALGIGRIEDIILLTERGVDTFDCVDATRIARHGALLISPEAGGTPKNKYRLNIKKSQNRDDERPIDSTCNCPICRIHTRAYLHHLYRERELIYDVLATMHNLSFMYNFMSDLRKSIKEGKFDEFKKYWLCEN
ncbi:MAG: tRNA guanosine(34) transglycosylase Tgt [Candidatus Aenigmatarchaeota archaeon]